MARKRKKSKAKKQRKKGAKPFEATASSAEESPPLEESPTGAEPDQVVVTLDEGEATSVAVDADDVVPISLDDDDGDEDALTREQLIAETLALAATEEGGTGVETEHLTAGQPEAEAVEQDEDSSDQGAVEEPQPASGDSAAPTDERSAPLLTPAARLALSEIRPGDVGKPGAELVLDLGEGTTPEERDRILAAALAQVEMQEAIYRVPTDPRMAGRGKSTIALLLMLAALFVSVRPPSLVVPDPPARLSMGDQVYGTRVALLMQMQQIEAYRTREQRLPESLGEVGVALPGVRFVKSSNRLYQLVAFLPDGGAIVYDSASPAPEFERISRSWTTTRGAS